MAETTASRPLLSAPANSAPSKLLLEAVDVSEPPHVLRLSKKIYCGGEPASPEAFQELHKLGVTTIVSVDGATPRLEEAGQQGLRYIHIPIGYDGVPIAAQQQLARVAREVQGPIYVHCHHGQHRAPAAAAILIQLMEGATAEDARQILEKAKTGQQYTGLWRDVEEFVLPTPDALLPDLVDRARIEPLVATMARMDRQIDRLDALAAAGWTSTTDRLTPSPAAESAASLATLLSEELRESARLAERPYDRIFSTWMEETATSAGQLAKILHEPSFDHAAANEALKSLRQHCRRCHGEYR